MYIYTFISSSIAVEYKLGSQVEKLSQIHVIQVLEGPSSLVNLQYGSTSFQLDLEPGFPFLNLIVQLG